MEKHQRHDRRTYQNIPAKRGQRRIRRSRKRKRKEVPNNIKAAVIVLVAAILVIGIVFIIRSLN